MHNYKEILFNMELLYKLATATLYAHCNTLEVKVGDVVKQGDKIAEIGSTGYATGPHCHFELSINGETVDPVPYRVDVEDLKVRLNRAES